MKRLHLVLSAFLLTATTGLAQNPNLGTSGAQFLKIPVSAREAGMGGAVVGLTNDVSAVFWNPAGLAKVEKTTVQFSHMRWMDMFDFDAAQTAVYFDGIGTFAASIIIFDMDKQEITTEAEPNGTGRFYSAQDLSVGLTYARFLTDKFSFGLTGKYIQQQIWNETASGFAFDVGTQYQLDFQNLTIAMRMSNFGQDLTFEGEDLNVVYDKSSGLPLNRLTPARLVTDPFALPLSFQVGVGFDVFTTEFVKMKAGIDALHPNDNKEQVLTGTEVVFYDRLFLRGGYKFNADDEDVSFGIGTNLHFGSTKFIFDYAYSSYNILPAVNRISVGMEF
ncbi:MAG: PorV/PorQ family protein [Bacteroidetes bacterium]|nr:PorV/PorQ family protein [Bacteroidota bacterium]